MIESGYQSLGPFTRLEIGGGLSVLVTRGDGFSVRVEADAPSRLAKLDLLVIEGTLRAKCRPALKDFLAAPGFGAPGAKGHATRLIIAAPALVSVKAHAAAEVNVETLTGDEIEISASTNAEVIVDSAKARSLKVKASTGGRLTVSGACDTIHAKFSHDGLIAATELCCSDAVIDGSHGGTLELTAIRSVGGSLTSGAHMHLFGRPDDITVKTSSNGMLVTN